MNSPLNMQADNATEIFVRIGQLTRLLRDSMANLGLEQAIMEVADAFPNTRDRLNYVVGKTSQAADRALTSVEVARPLQEGLSENATALSAVALSLSPSCSGRATSTLVSARSAACEVLPTT